VEPGQFNPAVRERLRLSARRNLGLPDEAFVLLLVGNDWKKKGLSCLLEALRRSGDPRLWLLVVGRDDPAPFEAALAMDGLGHRIRFLPPRPDVEFYYAAADCYVAPSLEDAFALPVAEAMACGLPVIVSSHAGASEIVTDGADGLILKDPRDPEELAALIRRLSGDPELRERLGGNAVRTARNYTWEQNAAALDAIFREAIRSREGSGLIREGRP
jgi:UDP-glucose:(heptosyl)LPS alpha-1,3-glucosyltransferase